MTPAHSLPWSDDEIRSAALELIATHDRGAAVKSGEIVQRLKSEGLFSLARTWQLIGDKIEELRDVESRFAAYGEALKRNVLLSE